MTDGSLGKSPLRAHDALTVLWLAAPLPLSRRSAAALTATGRLPRWPGELMRMEECRRGPGLLPCR